jgi:hypothetical protein
MAEHYSFVKVTISCNGDCGARAELTVLPGEDDPPWGIELPAGWSVLPDNSLPPHNEGAQTLCFWCPEHSPLERAKGMHDGWDET